MEVERSVDPQLIIWQNYGINIWERLIRTLLFWLIVLGMLYGCLIVVATLEKKNWSLAQEIPKINCAK